MKNKFSLGSLALLGLFLMLSSAALASTIWYVNGVNGSDTNNCETPQTVCKTIGHAISLASSGDSIMVPAATYNESLTLNLNLEIVGSGAATTIIDGRQGIVNNAGVTLSKMTVRRAKGGVQNNGTLTVNDSTVSDGLGVTNYGTMTLSRSVINNNTSTGFDGYSGGASGIDNESILTINNSTISDNRVVAEYTCGGGICNTGDANHQQ